MGGVRGECEGAFPKLRAAVAGIGVGVGVGSEVRESAGPEKTLPRTSQGREDPGELGAVAILGKTCVGAGARGKRGC